MSAIKKSELAGIDDEAGQTLAQRCKNVMPHIGRNKSPLATHENIAILLNMLGVDLRYNVMKKETEIIIPDAQFTTENYYSASATWVLSHMRQVEMPTGQYNEMLELLADSKPFNPVESWVLSKKWDGRTRIPELLETITPVFESDLPAIAAFISKWLLGALESICNPKGADMSGILVLQGSQEIGKTWWVRKLLPDHLVEGAVRVGVQIDPANKDSVEQCVCHWIVEFGELDGVFRKADIAALKNFLTRPSDTFRKSFARRKSEYPRRTAFIASVNEWSYLVDETGNRRFWTIACKAIDSYHDIDVQQLWAEIYYKRMIDKLPYTLDANEKLMLKEINERHQVIDPINEMLAVKYKWDSDKTYWRYLTATQIALEMGYQRPEARDVRKIASYIRKMNHGDGKRSGGKDLLFVPNKEDAIADYY